MPMTVIESVIVVIISIVMQFSLSFIKVLV